VDCSVPVAVAVAGHGLGSRVAHSPVADPRLRHAAQIL
jgi:hypothetical protein